MALNYSTAGTWQRVVKQSSRLRFALSFCRTGPSISATNVASAPLSPLDRTRRGPELLRAAHALDEVGLEHAVDADRVAEERVGQDAVVVHVVEPVDRRVDDRLVLARPDRTGRSACSRAGRTRSTARSTSALPGSRSRCARRVVVRLEPEDHAAPDLAERQGLDEGDRLREERARASSVKSLPSPECLSSQRSFSSRW